MTSHGPKAQGKNLKRAALTGSLLWIVRVRFFMSDLLIDVKNTAAL